MAKPHYVPIRLWNTTSDPTPSDGDIWYRSDTDLVKFRANGATESVAFLPLVDIRTSATGTINSTTLVTVCTVTCNVGTYHFAADLGVLGNGTASTPGFALQGTAVTSAWRFTSFLAFAGLGVENSGTTLGNSTSGAAVASLSTTTTHTTLRASGTFTVTTAGTIIAALSRTTGSGTFTGRPGSNLIVHRTA